MNGFLRAARTESRKKAATFGQYNRTLLDADSGDDMKKTLTLFALLSLLSVQAFAAYWVVLKDGTKYKAKAKPAITNGKALVQLESGASLTLDANLIDFAKSDQQTKLGLGDANVINIGVAPPPPKPTASPLGSSIKLRKPPPTGQQAPSPADTAPANPALAPVGGPTMSREVVEKFERAFENIGIFEHKVTSTGPNTIHAEVTADSEEKVFNAISATAFLMVRNAGVQGAQVEMVELFMGTVTGGSSGRFRMTREDATAIDNKFITRQDYFVRKVLF
jgi:hypothetical protein